jgi:hypothetical protein
MDLHPLTDPLQMLTGIMVDVMYLFHAVHHIVGYGFLGFHGCFGSSKQQVARQLKLPPRHILVDAMPVVP